MGLDAVEVWMAVEEAFDIELENADVDKIRTPRDMIEVIMSKVGRSDPTACLTQRAFNLLRRALLHRLPLKRRDIAPSVRLANLVPKPGRWALLERLAKDLQTDPLPDLVRPAWMVRLLTVQSVTLGVVAGFAAPRLLANPSFGACIIAGLSVAVAVHICGWIATARASVEFPPAIATVGDLSRWVMAHKSDLANPTGGRWTREQVAARVREIVIDQLGCESTYREDALFIEELGWD